MYIEGNNLECKAERITKLLPGTPAAIFNQLKILMISVSSPRFSRNLIQKFWVRMPTAIFTEFEVN